MASRETRRQAAARAAEGQEDPPIPNPDQQQQGQPQPQAGGVQAGDIATMGQAIGAALVQGLQGMFTNIQQNQTQAINNLGNQMVNAINAMGANQGGGGQPPNPQPQQAVVFARNPGMLNPNVLLDYAKKEKLTIYKDATKPLYGNGEELFDMTIDRFDTFMDRLKERCTKSGFLRNDDNDGSIIMIPDSIDPHGNQVGPFVNIVTNYTDIDTTKVTAYEVHLRTAADRQAQNLDMLYQMIWDSLSEDGQRSVKTWSTKYEDSTDDTFRRGLSLLTTIIGLKTISSVATVQGERLRITQLPAFTESVEGDILKMHEEVNDAMAKLKSYGSTYPDTDLLIELLGSIERGVQARRLRHVP